ncbi:TonB-dependent receptor [Pedobacter sp. SYSU D00535]|uniref:TonB-dependent receptor n=1 Tax=Pedobacter sp. SYSU D00535 TaxID=2810308 RepID=UPI001A96C3D6|nr:TonB-dependent receptor [Pedobacter sp. SYSU D00535]
MKIKTSTLHVILLLMLIGFVSGLQAQNATGIIEGKISSRDGAPAAGVNVGLKEASKSVFTNDDGTFTIRQVKPGVYTVKTSSIGLESQEKTVTVQAGQVARVDFVLPESSEKLNEVVVTGYKSANQKPLSIGKAGIKPIDNPQMMAVVSSAVIRDQQANRLSDVIKNVNGVALGTTRGSTSETFFARGYNLGSTNMFKNGSRVSSGALPEASTLESVEVLKGSAALLYGNVTGGAVLNLVTKKPKFEYGGEVSLRAGSYSLYKPTGDVYGPITKNVAFRLIGTYENAESFRNSVKSDRYYFNPSLLYKLGDKTELLLEGDYQDYDLTPDFGVGSVNNRLNTTVSRSSFFNTTWGFNRVQQGSASAQVNHEISDNWKLNSIISYQGYNRNYFSTERIAPATEDGLWNRTLTRSKLGEDYYNGQINLTGKVKTGSITHTFLAGTDAETFLTTNTTFKKFNNNYDSINILTGDFSKARTDIPQTVDSLYTINPVHRFGVYAQDLIELTDKFKVLAGLRWTYQKAARGIVYDANSDERVGYGNQQNAALKQDNKYDRAFSPRVGLIYQPIKTTSIFVSYTNNFVTNTGIDASTGGSLRPSILDQYEVGVKNDFLNGKVSANLSYYRIVNDDFVQTALGPDGNPVANTDLKEFTGQTTSDGFELDLNGSIISGLDFIGGYSYNFMRYTKTSGKKGSYYEGERLVGNTAHTANASLFYTFSATKLRGVRLGASAFYTGKRNAGWNNTVEQTQKYNRLIPVSGFTTIDLSAGYTFKRLSVLAKVSNLTDELNYYVHENYSVNPIAPRQFMTTLTYKF